MVDIAIGAVCGLVAGAAIGSYYSLKNISERLGKWLKYSEGISKANDVRIKGTMLFTTGIYYLNCRNNEDIVRGMKCLSDAEKCYGTADEILINTIKLGEDFEKSE